MTTKNQDLNCAA